MKLQTRVLSLGLDSFDPDLMHSLIDQGVMPHLAKLVENGVSGPLSTGAGLGDDPNWASLYTGCLMEEHGKYYYKILRDNSYKMRYWHNDLLKRRPFWEHLSRQGKRVAIVDVPKCPLATGLYGVQVCNWYVHGQETPLQTSPPELKEHLLEHYGIDPIDSTLDKELYICTEERLDESQRERVLEGCFSTMRNKADFSLHLLQQGNWDLFFVCFKEPHCLLHQFWEDKEQLTSFFQELDSWIGKLVEAAGEEAQTMLFSTLGMEENITGNHLLDDVLKKLEPWSFPWRRRAYCLPHNSMSGAVRLSVKGRDKGGVLQPGMQVEEYVERLSQELLELRNPATDELVVEEIVKSGNQLTGASATWLPDLFVVWRKRGAAPIDAVAGPKSGITRGEMPQMRTGNHKPGGSFCAVGPGITPGLKDGAIEDIAPTICALLGEPLPNVSGKALLSRVEDLSVF